jgi:hypothetical protein
MPDLTIDKLLIFFFAVAPGVVAMQFYSLLCPWPERNWGNSLVEALTYSTIILAIWGWWVLPLVKRPVGMTPAAAVSPTAAASAVGTIAVGAGTGQPVTALPAASAATAAVPAGIQPTLEPLHMGELTAALFIVCLFTPAALAGGWYWLRISALHR